MKKRILSAILSVGIILSMFAEFSLTASATTNGHSVDDALAWCEAQMGKSLDWDKNNSYQCVDFLAYYLNYLGHSEFIGGNASNYATKTSLPSGWTRIQYYNGFIPQKGDIAIWTYSLDNNGHVAVISGANATTMWFYNQNWNGGYVSNNKASYSYGTFYGVIRPDFNSHTHSYTSSVTTKPTCTQPGVRTYTCSCGASYTETIPATGHTPVTDKGTPATCTEAGLSEGSHCSVCKAVIKAQEAIPALGHSLVTDKGTPATCTEAGLSEGSHCSVCKTVIKVQETIPALGHSLVISLNSCSDVTYTCKNCTYSHNVNNAQGYSEWVENKLAGFPENMTEKKAQYKSSKKETTTSTESSLDDWSLINSEPTSEFGEYGSWSGWSKTAVSSSSTRQVETKTVTDTASHKEYTYYYYRYFNTSANAYYYTYSSSMGGTKATITLTSPMTADKSYSGHQGYKKTGGGYYNYSAETWWLESEKDVPAVTHTEYRYRDKEVIYTYHYYRWTPFSGWQDTPITADENTQVETRTIYRYKLGDENHKYEICKDGTNHWYECSICHSKKDYSAHVYDNACDTTCNVCGATRSVTHSYKTTWSSDGANHWHECSVCGAKKDTAKHSFVGNKCSVCGYATSYDLSPELSSARGSAGDTVKLTLSIDQNTLTKSGAISFELPSGFTIVDGEWKYSGPSKNDSGSSAVNILSFTASNGRGAFTYDSSSYYINGSVFELTVKIPDNCADGEYSVTGALQIVTPQKTALSIENSVATISVSKYIAGDLDVSGLVDADDAIYLLYHCFFADEYPVNQPCDFTKDGYVDADDAIYLLYHCFFADEYPLN